MLDPSFHISTISDIRDWDWNFASIWHYVVDLFFYHIYRLGWLGWIAVPFAVWALALLFLPTRYMASRIGIDIYQHTFNNLFGWIFRLLETVLKDGVGLLIARLRGASRFVSNWFRSGK
jgi:hypothetical protein